MMDKNCDTPFLELKNITKEFPGVVALSGVSLDIRPGEIHALCGENGAGKSTLIKVLTGFHKRTAGEMYVDGVAVDFSHPMQAIAAGIACIYQELSIVPQIDVAKNLFLGNWPEKNGFLDSKTQYAKAEEILKRISLNVSPKTLAADLSIAQQQMVEIGRALTRNARVIIMDEPTSSLTDKEAETLMDLIRQLKEEGTAVVYISHRLDEVMDISDRITVLCDGHNVTTVNTRDINRAKLIELMLGRPLDNMYNKQKAPIGDVVLEVEGLTRKGYFEDVSFSVRCGEVLGFFGLVGAGRSEVMRAIFGIDKKDRGTIRIDGAEIDIKNPVQATQHGIALVPEDRKKEGIALGLSICANMTLVKLPQISVAGFINRKKQKQLTDEYISSVQVKTPSSEQLVGNLSGGNQQKVVIAKWLMEEPKILILDEPTRGIDVGSKAEIYGLIYELAKKGVAVIVISSDLQEITGISDRIVTMCEGRTIAEFVPETATDKEILASVFGGEQS